MTKTSILFRMKIFYLKWINGFEFVLISPRLIDTPGIVFHLFAIAILSIGSFYILSHLLQLLHLPSAPAAITVAKAQIKASPLAAFQSQHQRRLWRMWTGDWQHDTHTEPANKSALSPPGITSQGEPAQRTSAGPRKVPKKEKKKTAWWPFNCRNGPLSPGW